MLFQASLALRDDVAVALLPVHIGVSGTASSEDSAIWRTMDPVRFRALSNGERMEFGLAAPPSLLRVVLEVPFPGRWWFVSELRTPRRLEIRLGSNVLGPFGESRPFKERPVATTDLAIPLDLKGPIDTLFLLVEEPKGPCVLKAHFTPDRLLPGEVEARTFGNGLILGYMLAIFLVSGFLWLAVREKAFGWYVAYFAAALAWLAVKRGSAFAWVWPDHPAWNDGASVALAYLAMGCFALFLVHILELPRHLPRLARALTVGACIEFFLLPIAFFCLLNFNRMALTLVGWFQVILPLTMLGALLHRAFSRDRLALWLLIAFLPLALGMIYGVLVEFGFSAAGPASKAFVLAVGALCENTMTTLILIREVHRRERARLALEREFHAKVVEQADGYFREVAQELHDDLGQRTFSMRMQLFAQGAALTDSDRRLAETVDSLHKDLRKLSRRLHPPQLRENGLQDALEDLCRGFDAESGMQVRLVCTPGLPELPVAANLHLYRIVQESLVNAHRHGGATEVELALIRIPGGVRLAVTDNGNGFDSEVVEGGLGMAGMSSRAQAMGGQFVVRSRVGHGTRLQLDLPLEGKGGYA